MSCELDSTLLPVKAPQLVGKDDALERRPRRQGDLEWIALHLRCDRAKDGELGALVVDTRRQDKRRATPALFASGLRIEGEPNEVPRSGTYLRFTTPLYRRGGQSVAGISWSGQRF
jgi:hypothetical protein